MTTPSFSLVDRDYIVEQLRHKIADIDFVKSDGTLRTLKCTLRGDLLPAPSAKPLIDTLKKPRVDNPEVIAVWDLESEGWRSFRIDSVQSVTIREGI
jgi:hypothetical protein